MAVPNGPFIFVSYSNKDASFVHVEIKRLERQGYKVWYDKGELQPARFWAEEIRQAIAGCTCFMVFITEDSVLSHNVCDEIEQALQANKPFIAVYWDNVELPAGLQQPVRSRQTLDRHSMHQAAYEDPLSKALSEYIPNSVTLAPKLAVAPMLVPVVPAPVPDTFFPKLLCFGLALFGAFFLFLAIVVVVAPNIISGKSPDDIINNRLAGLATGVTFIFVGLILSGAAVVVFRKYLRRTT
jgi:hypothetical protein